MRGKKNSIAGAMPRPGALKGGKKPALGKPAVGGKLIPFRKKKTPSLMRPDK
jgi:hypothetical protein